MPPVNLRGHDPGPILDCLIVALVRGSFKVKLNAGPTLIVEPYSDGGGGQYGRGCCFVNLDKNGNITLDGELRAPQGNYCHGVFATIPLEQPDALEVLVRRVEQHLLKGFSPTPAV